jgi:UDP-N-acetylmuramate dehydrogenase
VDFQDHVPLGPLTTLGIGGASRRFVRVASEAELREALATTEPVFILGGGSNLVVSDAGWDGLAIQLANDHIDVRGEQITAGAGAVWDDLVARAVDAGLAGVECLSGIPGLVGAVPMQNVGAYGQEVADTITHVRLYDRERGEFVTMVGSACGFGYRTSRFRASARWIVVEVTFQLSRVAKPPQYAELSRALAAGASLADVRRMVITLRRGKGMVVDPADPDSRSAGSFFTNPIVPADDVAEILELTGPELPRWPQSDGQTKLSAAWLIERAGFPKGTTRGSVGISKKHALALVNLGGATATELLALASEIAAGVHARFGVILEREPILV